MVAHDQISEFTSAVEELLPAFGIQSLGSHQLNQLVKHYSMMVKWNSHINLTRIVSPQEAARFHYAESLFASSFAESATRVLDIGSGAGFPAVPLAVARPELYVTALEANQKKALFLAEAKDALGLANLSVIRERIERFETTNYGLLTSRALEQPEAILLPVANNLKRDQRLLLFCSQSLVNKFRTKSEAPCEISTYPIPLADDRLIAIFSCL